MDLNIVWFLLIGVLLTGYVILDGFDLGVGFLHLFTKGDTERRTTLNAIGPVWDGNEVWLVTGGGALFAAFPHAYATAFSAFYLAFMLLLFALIFRAVAIEVRSKEPMPWWRELWDRAFCIASTVAAVLFGVALGNLIAGMPIGDDFEFRGSFLGLLKPYPLVLGAFALALFAMHGAIYLYMKTEGELQAKVKRWIPRTFAAFVALYATVTGLTLWLHPHMTTNFREHPWVWVIAVLNALAIANIPRALHLNLPFRAFVSSCLTIVGLMFLFAAGTFPNLIASTLNPEWSLTIYNAASSQKTLKIMLWIAIAGMPFVLSYTAAIYWVFRGKVTLEKFSY